MVVLESFAVSFFVLFILLKQLINMLYLLFIKLIKVFLNEEKFFKLFFVVLYEIYFLIVI